MEQDTDKVRGRDPMRTIHTIAIAAALTMFVTVGKGIKEAWPRGGQLGIDEVLIKNKF